MKKKSPVAKAFSLVIRIECDILVIRGKLRWSNCPILLSRHSGMLQRKDRIVNKYLTN